MRFPDDGPPIAHLDSKKTSSRVRIAKYVDDNRLRHFEVEAKQKYDLDPPSIPHHGSVDLSRFLEGHARTNYGKEWDSQRQKLYDAQRAAGIKEQAQSFESLSDCAKAVAGILCGRPWQRRYEVPTVILKPGYGAKRATAGRSGNWGPIPDKYVITLPRYGRNMSTIAHELIHITVPKPHPGHGRLYCARFLEAVGGCFDQDAKHRLEAAYKRHGVKYTPREIHA